MRFKLMIGGLVAVLVAYAVFWFVAAHHFENRIVEAIQERRDQGMDIRYGDLSVSGFPYRLEATFEDVHVGGQKDGLAWQVDTPRFAAVVLPWRPRHAVTFAETATLALTRDGTAAEVLTTHGMRNSVIMDGAGGPERISMTAVSLALQPQPDAPPEWEMTNAEAHWRAAYEATALTRLFPSEDEASPKEPLQWQFAAKAQDIAGDRLAVSPYGRVIEELQVVMELHGAGLGPGATLQAIAAWRDNGGTVDVPSFMLKWGELDVKLSGSVTLDRQFRLLGALTAQVRGFEPVIDRLQQDGVIDAQEALTAKETLGSIAGSVENQRLTVPITLQGGRMFVGPLPVANLQPLFEPGTEL
jgi:hypothetical protein